MHLFPIAMHLLLVGNFLHVLTQELHRMLAALAGAACSGILSHPSLSSTTE